MTHIIKWYKIYIIIILLPLILTLLPQGQEKTCLQRLISNVSFKKQNVLEYKSILT